MLIHLTEGHDLWVVVQNMGLGDYKSQKAVVQVTVWGAGRSLAQILAPDIVVVVVAEGNTQSFAGNLESDVPVVLEVVDTVHKPDSNLKSEALANRDKLETVVLRAAMNGVSRQLHCAQK